MQLPFGNIGTDQGLVQTTIRAMWYYAFNKHIIGVVVPIALGSLCASFRDLVSCGDQGDTRDTANASLWEADDTWSTYEIPRDRMKQDLGQLHGPLNWGPHFVGLGTEDLVLLVVRAIKVSYCMYRSGVCYNVLLRNLYVESCQVK